MLMVSDQTLQTILGLRPHTVALWGGVIRGTIIVLICAVLGGLVMAYVQSVQSTVTVRHLQDFGLFYEASKQAHPGGDLYGVTRLPGEIGTRQYWNMNPPHFHLIILPLTVLSPSRAFAVWMMLSGAALVWSIVLIRRSLRLNGTALFILCVLVLAWAPMMLMVMTGQVGLLLLLPFTLAWYRARQGRLTEAGAWVGLCASIKLFLLLFVAYFALQRQARAVRMAAVTLVGAFAVGLAVYGVSTHRAWITHLSSVSWAEHYANASLLGAIERTFSTSEWGHTPIVDWPWLVAPLWVAIAGGVGVVTLWRVSRIADMNRKFLFLTAAALLISPLGWVYYLWLLLGPLAATVRSGVFRSRWHVGLLAMAILGLLVPPPLPWMTLKWGHGLWTVTLGSVYFWSLLALWLVAWSDQPAERP